MLSEKSLKEGQSVTIEAVNQMATATSNLIKANKFIPADGSSSLDGGRNTIPIDFEAF